MEQMYQDYKDVAAVYIVYIKEAHAMDGSRPVAYAKELGIKEHKSFGERCTVASRLVADKKLTIPCLVDNMDNAAEKAYEAWPDRVFLIRKDGKLAVAGHRGPWGFEPALTAAGTWLAQYKESGVEPPPVQLEDTRGDPRELMQKMTAAYHSGDHAEALKYAQQMHEARPESIDTIYNIACLQCLLGHKEEAYTWLEKAIDAGYDDADHLRSDDDFKSIRGEERFQKLVERISKPKKRRWDPRDI